jgi:hypothetical protein
MKQKFSFHVNEEARHCYRASLNVDQELMEDSVNSAVLSE